MTEALEIDGQQRHRGRKTVTRKHTVTRSPSAGHDATIRVAMNTTRQREQWDGDSIELGDAWTLRKGEKVARCILVTPAGVEPRLMTTDMQLGFGSGS
jgi:hypothetical protein